MAGGFDNKTLKLKWGGLHAVMRGNLTALIWKDKQVVHILMNMHRSSAEVNFCEEHGKAQKPVIVEDHSQNMGCIKRWNRSHIIVILW
jgi:hypothetical protein